MILKHHIIEKLPYGKGFLFVDEIIEVSNQHIVGSYFFSEELNFYNSHFKQTPITPGVLITECAAQIGLACFGIFLLSKDTTHTNNSFMALSESNMVFNTPLYPNETCIVRADLVYFRFNKLKVKVEIKTNKNQLIAKGLLSGMLANSNTNNAK